MLLMLKMVFDFYLYILLLRLLFQKYRAPFHNPICLFVVRITEPLLKPVRRFIPGYKGWDLAIVACMAILQAMIYFLLVWLSTKLLPNIFGILIMTIVTLADKWFDVIFFAVIIQAILSWFPALQNSAVTPIAQLLSDPWLRVGRRFIPPIAGFDFTPLVILLLLKFVSWLVFYPIINWGLRIAIS